MGGQAMMTLEELKKALVGNYICENAIYIGRIADIKEVEGTEGLYCVIMDSMGRDFVTRRNECGIYADQLDRLASGEEVQMVWTTRRTSLYHIASKDGAAKTYLFGVEPPLGDPSKVNGWVWLNGDGKVRSIPPSCVTKLTEMERRKELFMSNVQRAFDDISTARWFDDAEMSLMIEMPSCIAYVVEGNDTVVKSYGREDEIDNTERYMKPCEKRKS